MNIDITEKEQKLVIERFQELKTERNRYVSRWKDIQNYVAITNEVNSEFDETRQPNEQKDVFINDPTGFVSVNQAGDYLAGILWNANAVTLKPSEYIKNKAVGTDLSDFYQKATKKFLSQINSTDAGFSTVLKSCAYDQYSYGTSGIGTFLSREYLNGQSECCLNFKSYGVWNSCCDEGANNKIDVVYTVYHWRLNQIVEEFCYQNGELSKELVSNMPEEIQDAIDGNKFNKKFKIVYGILPNNSFTLGKRGKNGARYKGYWFIENSEKKIFKVDYYSKMPISICRAIRAGSQIYGESAGTLAISSIKMLNYIKGTAVDNIEKTTDQALGVVSGALVAGNVINRSAGAVTTFNPQALANGQNPIFPIAQTGDISAIVNFLIPELKKDIINIFKIDQLLDFNNQTQMTATESSFRMSIRGKSINGLLMQEVTELVEPTCHRAISIIQECGLFGLMYEEVMELPENTLEEVIRKKTLLQNQDFIPPIVADAMKDGKPWYTITFNGELAKLCNAEVYESIGRFLQYLSAIINLKPEIVQAINAYEFLELLKSVSNLVNDKLIKNKYEYEELLKKFEEAAQKQAEQQTAFIQSQAVKNMANAEKDGAIANANK